MPQRVLLAITDSLLAQSVGNLMPERYQVSTLQRSDQLVREAEQLQPQLLILDDEFSEEPTSLCLTLHRRLPATRLLYLSSNWQPSLAAQLEAHGVDIVLRKPFATDRLLGTTHQLLEAAPC